MARTAVSSALASLLRVQIRHLGKTALLNIGLGLLDRIEEGFFEVGFIKQLKRIGTPLLPKQLLMVPLFGRQVRHLVAVKCLDEAHKIDYLILGLLGGQIQLKEVFYEVFEFLVLGVRTKIRQLNPIPNLLIIDWSAATLKPRRQLRQFLRHLPSLLLRHFGALSLLIRHLSHEFQRAIPIVFLSLIIASLRQPGQTRHDRSIMIVGNLSEQGQGLVFALSALLFNLLLQF